MKQKRLITILELNHNIKRVPSCQRKVQDLNRFVIQSCVICITVEPFQCYIILVAKTVPHINIRNFVLPMIRQRAMMI